MTTGKTRHKREWVLSVRRRIMVHKDNDAIGMGDAEGTAGKGDRTFSAPGSAPGHAAGSTVISPAPDKVVDFLAWRRARPLPSTGTTSVETNAVILPLFQDRAQALPAFDYSGDAAARRRPSPQPSASPARTATPQSKAGQPARALRTRPTITDSAAAHKWDPRNWPSGLSWLVKNMADGMIDMNNLQAMLSDMQQELDALESSMDRLRGDAGDDSVTDLDPNDLELVSPHELSGPRRACDMTGRPVGEPSTDATSIEMTKGD
jgi:hypothetical protein